MFDATLVDRRNATCDLVAPIVPIAVPVSSETHDEEMGDLRKRSHGVKHLKFQCWKEHMK